MYWNCKEKLYKFAHPLLVIKGLKVLDNDLNMRNVPICMELGEIKVDSYVLRNMS